ncbi:MAG: ABC transporter permease [Candidatus Aminicenantes bacterium]|nr:ABC transporter permease [Candidatus Aminicenantes bacterium]
MKKPKKSGTAFNLDEAVSHWIRELQRSAALEDGMITELESHLRDEVEDLIEEGKSPEEAFQEATASVESAEKIGKEYYKTISRGFLATPPGNETGFSIALFLNSLKVSLRKIRRQKWYSLISVTGLAVGMACSILIFLWVKHELSYDRFHKNTKDIYRVIMEDPLSDSVSVHPWLPFPLGSALQNEFPEISAFSRYRPDNMVVRYEDKSFTEQSFLTVDAVFFKIFSFPFLQGNPSEALVDPNSIVIRDTMAKKYFGGEDPIGKVLNLSGRADLSVSGVVHIPETSDFQFDFFFTFQSYPLFNVDLAPLEANWSGKNYQIYLLLQRGSSYSALEEKISGFLSSHTPGQNEVLRLQKLSRIHLFKPDGSDGAIRYVRIFSLIAVFILLIACINFMNLATARFKKRAKEVTLRKMLGGTRRQLIRQFFSESFLHVLAASAVALLIVELTLPVFNQITLCSLKLGLFKTELVFGLAAIILMVGFISGLYPALFLSSFSSIQAGKVIERPKKHGSPFRKILVVFQFTLSTMLIIGTFVVQSQFSFIMNRDLGMYKESIVYHLMQKKTRDSVSVVREELLKHPDILGVTSCSSLPFNIESWIGYIDWKGLSPGHRVFPAFISVDHAFVDTVGLTIIEGRNFSRFRSDNTESFVINETAREQIGIKNPIGLELSFWGRKGKIIGVVNDFTNRQMTFTTAPMILSDGNWGAGRNYLLLRLRQGNPGRAIKHFRQVWEKANPGFPSEYEFLDEVFDRMYTNEKRLSKLLFSFAALAIFISCLGLIGLSSYKAEEKTKEIGIRKTLGASTWKIISLFSMDFTKLVSIANIVAWPIIYVIMHRWLQGYAYRTSISIWMFILAGGLGLCIALLSVGYQTLRVATANPVESLRYE